ncbi:molybdopterin-dependent oxidoreductase [Chloroflexota bacterium]
MKNIYKTSTAQKSTDVIKYTTCGYHCLSWCPIKVRVRDGRIIAVEPDDTINPRIPREDLGVSHDLIDKGLVQTRACPKGYAQWKTIYDPNRIIYPMKRVGKRGEAKFARISWDEALDTITSKLVETKENYGPYSILHHPYSNFSTSSFPLGPWFGAGIAGWDSHSANGWNGPEKWVLGKAYEDTLVRQGIDFSQDETNVLKAKLIVFWGLNPATTFNGDWLLNLLRAKERKIPIICIDARYTASAEVLADQWIPIRPTTDVSMMIAVANVWFKEDLCDNEFINKYVEPDGLAKWKAYVLGISDGVDKTPQWAETICGVPAETITAFARLYATSKPVNLNVSFSIGRQFYGENPTRASMYLQALSGNMCIPGGTAGAETGIFRGSTHFPYPKVDWQRKPGNYQAPVLLAGYKWMQSVDLREKLDNGEISQKQYNNVIGNAPENPSPNIKMVFIESNNHASSLPDINSNIRALKKLDFIVVSSYFSDNTSARYADLLLPQIATAYEGRHCVNPVHSTDLFKCGYHLGNYFLYRQKCVEPPGEVKSSDWIWVQIARRLGMAELYSPRLANTSDDEWDDTIEYFHKESYKTWAKREDIEPLHPPDWEHFQKRPVFRWPITDPHYPCKEEIEANRNPFRGTKSGKIEFHSAKLAKGPEYLASNVFDVEKGKSYGPGNLPPMAQMTKGGRDTFFGKDADRYPLLMSSPHSIYRVHSFLENNPWLKGDCYRHAIWISVADAKLRGINDNDLVHVYNDIGEMLIPAYVTSRVVPGTVVLFHGGWYRPSKEKSELMPDGIDIGGSPNFLTHNCDHPDTIVSFLPCKALVEIEKWDKPT